MTYFHKNFRDIKVSGKTIDDKIVLSGFYKVYSSEGVDLFYILLELKDKNMVLDIVDFINCAIRNGQNKYTLLEKIKHSYFDVYGKECENFLKKVEDYISENFKSKNKFLR